MIQRILEFIITLKLRRICVSQTSGEICPRRRIGAQVNKKNSGNVEIDKSEICKSMNLKFIATIILHDTFSILSNYQNWC